MNKLVLFIMVVLVHFELSAQKQDIEILQEQNENITTLVAKNNSDKKKIKVNLMLETQGYKVTPPPPYELVLEPLEKADIVKLIAKINEPQSLSYKISYSTVSGGTPSLAASLTQEQVMEKLGEKEVVIFTKTSCAKCAYAKKKMEEMGIKYEELPLEVTENSELMWSALFNQGFETSTVSTPVFALKGKVAYNINDMDVFLNGL